MRSFPCISGGVHGKHKCLTDRGLWSLAHPISSFAGGNDWATSSAAFGGIRETTELGVRRGLVTDREFRCKDGIWVQLLGLGVNRHLPKLCAALGVTREAILGPKKKGSRPDWTAAMRIVDAIMATKVYSEWHEIFKANDVWHVKVQRFEDMLDDPQAKSSGIFVDAGLQHPLIGCPVLLSEGGARPRGMAPSLGQHSASVLREFGIEEQQEADLRSKGIVK